MVVLLWGESQRDIEMCKEVLEQARTRAVGVSRCFCAQRAACRLPVRAGRCRVPLGRRSFLPPGSAPPTGAEAPPARVLCCSIISLCPSWQRSPHRVVAEARPGAAASEQVLQRSMSGAPWPAWRLTHTMQEPRPSVPPSHATAVAAMEHRTVLALPRQVCLAYKSEGGRIIAVLSSRPKPDMEQLLKEALPIDARSGSAIVVRQGARSSRGPSARMRRRTAARPRYHVGRGKRCTTGGLDRCLPRRLRTRVRCQGRRWQRWGAA